MQIDRTTILDYLTITSGVLGRLAISLVYFLVIANTLPLADFGVFAAAAAVGLVLSRLLAFGYISPVYRTASVRPRVLGAHLAGLGVLTLASLPAILLLAVGVHQLFFVKSAALLTFLLVVMAEVMGARVLEFSAITLNGLGRFGQAARLVVAASAIRTAAALGFWAAGGGGLDVWAWWNLASALMGAALGLAVFMPRLRLRFRPALYARRLKDAVFTAGSEISFYAQAELDKVAVLALAGQQSAGLYAIAMRLIDLTAVPIRSFNQLLVRRLMQEQGAAVAGRRAALIEAGVAATSVLGLGAVIVALQIRPGLLGANIASAAPLLASMILIPAFRNLSELHGELLYARELVVTRLLLLVALTGVKLAGLTALIVALGDIARWALPLTGVFALVYVLSALVTYRSLRP